MTDDDIAFVLGRGGMTKRKIARVAKAKLDVYERDLKIDIHGPRSARKRAKEYIKLVMAQRVGPVYMDVETKREDLTVVSVPSDCIGYVTGKRGSVLRSLEEEWGTLMFFVSDEKNKDRDRDEDRDRRRRRDPDSTESLCIFGPKRGRYGAHLKVLSAVEHKSKGWFLDRDSEGPKFDIVTAEDKEEGWDCEHYPMSSSDFSYALGAGGSTRMKLATASGCIIQYIGNVAFMCGKKDERKRGMDYLSWLIKQRKGSVSVEDAEDRDDCLIVDVPQQVVGFITGYKGSSLRSIERESSTFCFADGENRNEDKKTERLLIFSHSADNRKRAKGIVEGMVKQKMREDDERRHHRDRRRRRRRSRSSSSSRSRNRKKKKSRRRRERDRRRDDSSESTNEAEKKGEDEEDERRRGRNGSDDSE